MIVLDTNVISEPLRSKPNRLVTEWLASEEEPMYLASVSVGELLIGIAQMPAGKRRDGLTRAVESILSSYSERILPYNEAAARSYARMQAHRRSLGRPLSTEDGMIASICMASGASLATRNTRDFSEIGLHLIDPWGPASSS